MSATTAMSFAESYVLASKVRSKLTKQAANPKSSLRSLVLQANMLDNLMDHIAVETEKKKQQSGRVSFLLPEKPVPVATRGRGANITEYEVDLDSDLDSDYDDYALASDLDSDDDDYYYSSDEEEENTQSLAAAMAPLRVTKTLPTLDLSSDHDLLVIYEEDEDEELPELSRSTSLSDSESEDEMSVNVPHYTYTHKMSEPLMMEKPQPREEVHHHQRHNAIYSMQHVF